MSDPLLEPTRLANISPKAYEHPADRAATAALQSIPMLDQVVRRLIEFGYERAFRQSFLASSLKLGPDQLGDVWRSFERALDTLDMEERYDLYLTQFPVANAAAVGSGKPMVVVNSQLLTLLDEDEVPTVLAHEAGHILSDHVLYRTTLLILLRLTGAGRLPFLAGLPLLAVRSALLEWSRAAELSCDRAAVLVSRDPMVFCRTMMAMAAGVPSRTLDVNAFIAQAAEYEEWDSSWDRMSRFFTELGLSHAYPVRRVRELMDWVRGGDYDRILRGEYPKRDQDVDAAVAAGDAVAFYTERFQAMFQDAGEQVASAGERVSDWLRRRG